MTDSLGSPEAAERRGSDSPETASSSSATAGQASDSERAWIIILSWEGSDLVARCLASLQPVLARGHRVLVVDNGSRDGTPERVRSSFPQVELIENGRNLGYAGGNNVGIRRALQSGAEFVVLLNQDAVVAPDCIDELVAAASRHPNAGTVSAKIYFHDHPGTLWFAGAKFSARTGRDGHIGLGEIDRGQYDRERVIDRGCGCAMLLTRRFLEAVGLLDESLFLYGEEIDLALRARAHGFLNLFAPRAKAWHSWSYEEKGAAGEDHFYYMTRNLLRLVSNHKSTADGLPSCLQRGVIATRFLLSALLRSKNRQRSLKAVVEGWRHARKGRAGPRNRL